jgi:hypothetical protein
MSKQPEALQRSFDNGKYTVINNNGLLSALRYGEPWRELTGDNLVAVMFHEVDRLHEVNTELLEALKVALATIEDYLDYDHDGDPWTEDARSMGEMDVNDYKRDGRLDRARAAIAKATGEQ